MASRGGPFGGNQQSMDRFREEIQRAMDQMIEDPEYSPYGSLRRLAGAASSGNGPDWSSKDFETVCHDFVRTRLENSSWNEKIKAECVRIIKESGEERPDIAKVVAAVVPLARSLVPPEIKEDLVTLLKNEVLPIIDKHDANSHL